jgi:hypothetical protein
MELLRNTNPQQEVAQLIEKLNSDENAVLLKKQGGFQFTKAL